MEEFFRDRINIYQALAEKLENRSGTFTVIRITIFVIFISAWIFTLNESYFDAFLILLAIFPFLFGYIVNRHRKVNYQKQFNQHLKRINQEEVRRLKHKPEHFYNGEDFYSEEHNYSSDLDIFGFKSLYHYINRSATPSGEHTLAQWLSSPADKIEINKRQEAVQELKDEIDWRQKVQASEMEIDKKMSLQPLLDWVGRKENSTNQLILIALPAILFISIVLWLFSLLSFQIPIIIFVVNSFFVYRKAQSTQELSEFTNKSLAILKKYRHIINLIENKEVRSTKLVEIKGLFHQDKFVASKSLKKLERILEFLDARANMFYHILNPIFLIDLQLINQANSWKSDNKEYVSQWFEAIGELEALASIAGYSYLNSSFCFPNIKDEPFILDATQLGHPLIHMDERVSNDFHLQGKGSIAVVTGSNMSGKSTFLRTVGVNAVLAYAGAPVCADKLDLSVFNIFTSMRTHDDLEAHVSSFYAELKRIRKLLDLLKEDGIPILFALDEVLKGTNSRDRHAGALALARQLNELNCQGMISTHDLELGELASERENIVNFSFNSDITDGKIVFDYKINNGICRSFNASALMQQMGIDMKHHQNS